MRPRLEHVSHKRCQACANTSKLHRGGGSAEYNASAGHSRGFMLCTLLAKYGGAVWFALQNRNTVWSSLRADLLQQILVRSGIDGITWNMTD